MKTKLLQEENRVSRLSMRNLGLEDELSGLTSNILHDDNRVNSSKAPEIEMTKQPPSSSNDQFSNENRDYQEMPFKNKDADQSIKHELMELGGTDGGFDMQNDMMGMGMGMSGEEYFETNPNDNSYENTYDNIDNTNRDLLT